MFDRFFHPQPFHCVLAKPGRDTEFVRLRSQRNSWPVPVRECRAAEVIYPGRLFKLSPAARSAINAIQLRRGDLAITRRAPSALLSSGMCMAKDLGMWKDLVVFAMGGNCRADGSTNQSPIASLRTCRVPILAKLWCGLLLGTTRWPPQRFASIPQEAGINCQKLPS
jgi:hypothetical protein